MAGIAAAAAIAFTFVGRSLEGLATTVGVMLGLSFLVVLLGAAAKLGPGARVPTTVMMWFVVVATIVSASLSLSSFFFGWPLPWGVHNAKGRKTDLGAGAAAMSMRVDGGQPLPAASSQVMDAKHVRDSELKQTTHESGPQEMRVEDVAGSELTQDQGETKP
ncbi:MAG: hypothetical protein JNK64_11295 [Myxococcales bacterium]|nr:hypothetical protein [Myxococcales bacterium]